MGVTMPDRLVSAALGVGCRVRRGLLYAEAAGGYRRQGKHGMAGACRRAAGDLLCGDCPGLPGCLWREAEEAGQRRLPLDNQPAAVTIYRGPMEG